MSAFPNSPPHNADVHHRRIAAGRARTRTTAMQGGQLTPSIKTVSAKRLTPNRRQLQFATAPQMHSRRATLPVAQLVMLKSP
jgi:hypothetical protein